MERYSYQSGYFLKSGDTSWEEWQQGQRVFGFDEYDRNQQWIFLNDPSRSISVSLPLAGGQSFISIHRSSWSPLYEVRREQTEEGSQQTTLRQRVINFALQAIRWQDQYKPSAEELAGYYVEAGIVQNTSVVLPAVVAAVASGHSIFLWNRASEWCGIFATCILRRASVNVKWGPGATGSGGWGIVNVDSDEVEIVSGHEGIQPGDVAVIPNNVHHFIVTQINVSSQTVHSVDGNQENHTIRQRTDHKLSDINYYYRLVRQF